jgi:large subunit ribosomal protein L13
MKYTIDASGKKIGRVASQIAHLLMGKEAVGFSRNTHSENEVEVVNAGKASITDKKKETKRYFSYSLYPGGFKELTMKRAIEKGGVSDVLRRAVNGMLPKNKLRSLMIKNLKISE